MLASGRVRYAGEPVAVVFADDPYRAEDAADAVRVEIEALPPLLSAQLPPAEFAPGHTTEPAVVRKQYGDVDAARYAERKPLIWFWMMFDRSPAGLNHWLGYRLRYMLARHVLKHIGTNVKIFHGVELSFGYNLTVEDNCVIHKYVLLDDRGEIIIHEGSSISDYANVYSHAHDLNDGMIVTNQKTEIGPKARVTYHATVLSGATVGEHGMVGSMAVVPKRVEP